MLSLGGHQHIKCCVRLWILVVSEVTNGMSGRALLYWTQIMEFLAKRVELRPLELADSEWNAIKIISDWLGAYRQATDLMSATKQVTLSAVHCVFHGFQEHLKKSLCKLPQSAPLRLKTGLIKAQIKLADYHSYFDESPFYLWACCKCFFLQLLSEHQ
jgi:hypothetical protein